MTFSEVFSSVAHRLELLVHITGHLIDRLRVERPHVDELGRQRAVHRDEPRELRVDRFLRRLELLERAQLFHAGVPRLFERLRESG